MVATYNQNLDCKIHINLNSKDQSPGVRRRHDKTDLP